MAIQLKRAGCSFAIVSDSCIQMENIPYISKSSTEIGNVVITGFQGIS